MQYSFDWCYSEEFKKYANVYANALWEILNKAKNYSFAEDPLPVFFLLHAAFCDYDIHIWRGDCTELWYSNLSFDDDSVRGRILDLFPYDYGEKLATYDDSDVFDEFCELLNRGEFHQDTLYMDLRGYAYKQVHPFVVEFFIKKFIQLCSTKYELSEIFIDKIWKRINEYEACDAHFYIPYAGLSSIALHDIYNFISSIRVNYNCEEDNNILSLISKVRLCAHGHNPNLVKTSLEIIKEGFNKSNSGANNVHMISVPPFELKIKKENSNGETILIDVAENLITKFLEDDRIESAYFVFPMNFATNSIYANIRQKLVKGKLIKSIDLIPEGSFMTSSSAGILISLNKRNDSDTIKFVFDEGKYNDVSYNEIVNNDFILNPNLYFSEAKTDDSKLSYRLNRSMWELKHTTIDIKDDKPEISNVVSDLVHCLGPIFNRINCAIDINSDNEDFKLIKDNISYMTRVIKSFGADFSSYRTNKDEIGVNDFFQEYYSSLQNCNSSIYKIEYCSKLSDDTTFEVDEDVMRIMLDTILDNAYRHGFKKAKNIDARVGISTSCKRIKGKDFILIEVANNGLPFPNDLTFEKFISRGEFCGENGHTGLGGNHIYNIIKLHDGYLNITKSAKWNIIFDILIPIEYISDEDMNNITDYNNEDWCV